MKILYQFFKIFIFQVPVITEDGKLAGVITKKNIVNFLTQSKIKLNEHIKRIITKDFKKLNIDDPIKYLTRSLIRWNQVLIEDTKMNRFYLATHDDLLEKYLEKEDMINSH